MLRPPVRASGESPKFCRGQGKEIELASVTRWPVAGNTRERPAFELNVDALGVEMPRFRGNAAPSIALLRMS